MLSGSSRERDTSAYRRVKYGILFCARAVVTLAPSLENALVTPPIIAVEESDIRHDPVIIPNTC